MCELGPVIILEGLLMAIGFLTMSWLPKQLDPDDWQWNPARSWSHNLKDRMCARVRKDVEWWTKFHWFVIGVSVAAAIFFGVQ